MKKLLAPIYQDPGYSLLRKFGHDSHTRIQHTHLKFLFSILFSIGEEDNSQGPLKIMCQEKLFNKESLNETISRPHATKKFLQVSSLICMLMMW